MTDKQKEQVKKLFNYMIDKTTVVLSKAGIEHVNSKLNSTLKDAIKGVNPTIFYITSDGYITISYTDKNGLGITSVDGLQTKHFKV